MDNTAALPLGGRAQRTLNDTLGRPNGHAIRFTGSGSEYFRIWIVNLGLILVTLGLYYPWAKVRKRRYFYGNTLVAHHAFDFHGDPKRMLRGYLIVGTLAAIYGIGGHFSPLAAGLALLVLAVLWPALFRAAQQFRMANTSWCGLRFRFTGGLGGAYVAVLPLLLPALLFGALSVVEPATEQTPQQSPVFGVMAFAMLAMVLLAPLSLWLLKRYQHNHYALGERQTSLAIGPGSFYGVALRAIGVAMLALLTSAIVGIVMVGGSFMVTKPGTEPSMALAMLPALVTYGVMFTIVQPYVGSRTQNMVWSATASAPALRIGSDLRFGAFSALTLKNLLLTALTLGLYWPFAAVATARLRLEAVTVHLANGAATFAASVAAHDDAAGEAAGDLFGIDVGL